MASLALTPLGGVVIMMNHSLHVCKWFYEKAPIVFKIRRSVTGGHPLQLNLLKTIIHLWYYQCRLPVLEWMISKILFGENKAWGWERWKWPLPPRSGEMANYWPDTYRAADSVKGIIFRWKWKWSQFCPRTTLLQGYQQQIFYVDPPNSWLGNGESKWHMIIWAPLSSF